MYKYTCMSGQYLFVQRHGKLPMCDAEFGCAGICINIRSNMEVDSLEDVLL